MERRRQPNNEKRDAVMVMGLGEAQRICVAVTQNGYGNSTFP
jgi:hypothetical protein